MADDATTDGPETATAGGESAPAGGPAGRGDGASGAASDQPFGLPRWVVGLLPLVLLALVVAVFFAGNPMAGLASGGEPLPALSVDYTTVPDDHTLRLHVTNEGPPVTIDQVMVDEAYWSYEVTSPGEDARLARGEGAVVDVPYHWNPGYDYHVTLVTADGVTFSETFVAVQQTPPLTGQVVETLAVVGLFVGVIPIVLGMLWFPFMRTMSRRWLHAVLAFSAGILAFLAVDTGLEAWEIGGTLPGTVEGHLLVVLGALGSLLLVQAAMDWRTGDEPSALGLAYAAALGIGLHNLAEGLAIGGAFAAGRASLGAFLVVGFMLHNVTEGPVVVAPLADRERPSLWHFAALGLLAGAPVVLGGWVGTAFQDPMLSALFLAVGVGALAQVVVEVAGLVGREGDLTAPTNTLGFLVGFAVMYATDLLVTL